MGTLETPPQEALRRETNAMLKLVLSEMEELAKLAPVQATEPIAYNARRKRVMQKLWNLVKLAVRTGHEVPYDAR